MSLSVIIPTFNNVEFLSELFDSIKKSNFDGEYEVLIGIDSCKDTLKYVYENEFPYNFNFFFFIENKGPYLIKNTLTELSKYDKLFFFDSDDIMMPDLLREVNIQLNNYDVIKPKYIDFVEQNGVKEFVGKKPTFGEGVFGIKKTLFLEMNGFEGWKVAADSDFMGRLYKTNKKILHTSHILFHRRIHPNSLTIHPETGLSSFLRAGYFNKSKRKTIKDYSNKEFLKSEYKIVDLIQQNLSLSYDEIVNDEIKSEYEEKKIKHQSISDVFSNTPKETKLRSTQKQIDYIQINKNTNHTLSSNLNNALKKAKLENIKKNHRR